MREADRGVRGERPAISVRDLTKTYRLYPSIRHQAVDVLGLTPLLFWRRQSYTEFMALNGVTFDVGHGELVGVIGRNGAGKTTLLKLITGNFAPTSGSIEVNGSVQALLQVGLGFHPEYTGYDNLQAALVYNGLAGKALELAVQDVVDFTELGEFLHQPLKTYSLGMRSRLQFAAATAIHPDILVVDEVLGAGDAYFSVKSAARMKALTRSGCTLLLVSHSTQQILQFCDRALWIDHGRLVMDAEALPVVKAYEEYNQRLQNQASARPPTEEQREEVLATVLRGQERASPVHGPLSPGGLSRWANDVPGLMIRAVRIVGEDGAELVSLETGASVHFEIELEATKAGDFPCQFCIVVFTETGQHVIRCISERFDLRLAAHERCVGRLSLAPLLLGNGSYLFSAAAYQHLDLEDTSTAKAYDLLSRSFVFKVRSRHADDPSAFVHPSSWHVTQPAAAVGGAGA